MQSSSRSARFLKGSFSRRSQFDHTDPNERAPQTRRLSEKNSRVASSVYDLDPPKKEGEKFFAFLCVPNSVPVFRCIIHRVCGRNGRNMTDDRKLRFVTHNLTESLQEIYRCGRFSQEDSSGEAKNDSNLKSVCVCVRFKSVQKQDH